MLRVIQLLGILGIALAGCAASSRFGTLMGFYVYLVLFVLFCLTMVMVEDEEEE